MKRKTILMFGLVLAVLAGFWFVTNNENEVVQEEDSQKIKDLVHDYSVGNIKAKNVSITSHELIVTESDGNERIYDLPKEDFFVSIAPYIEETHPCALHNLTGCKGEMVNEEFTVYIEDTEGNVIVDDTLKSEANGFIDLWLPRDKAFHVTIEHDGKFVQSAITSFEDDNTCIATMQLAAKEL